MHFIIRAIVLIWLCVPGSPAAAHDGVHGPDILVRVEWASTADMQVNVRLTLTGLGGLLVLRGGQATGASVKIETPVHIAFAHDVVVDAALIFASAPPDMFTLTLDFGAAGVRAVMINPDARAP